MPVGFTIDNSIHNAVGGGLRFFLRSVAVPLVGFDAGYGIEARTWRFILLVGAWRRDGVTGVSGRPLFCDR